MLSEATGGDSATGALAGGANEALIRGVCLGLIKDGPETWSWPFALSA